MKNIEERPRLEKDLQIEVNKPKSTIANLWQNTINTRRQAFWNHHHAKNLGETYENLLACNAPKMPRKFLSKIMIMNQRVKRGYGNNFLLRSLKVKLPCCTRDGKDTSNDSKTLSVKWWHISLTNSMKKLPRD